jgi:rSAM/selenodomain-associated transferase 1
MTPAVAILAKAPVPGFAKTRLIPRLGAEGAAALHADLIDRAMATSVGAGLGPVTLWCAPDAEHPFLRAMAARHGCTLAVQPDGDLGARMLAAFAAASPLVLIGCDCPCLEPGDLRSAAAALEEGADVAIAPAEDGGYGLIAAARPFPSLFAAVDWGTGDVAAATRQRAREAGLVLAELRTVWDVDRPEDVDRARDAGLVHVASVP